jgi:hypothetical protein
MERMNLLIFPASILFLSSGCQSARIPITPSPTPVFFPLPEAVSLYAFEQPMVENMKTNQLTNGGSWITYTPPDWPKQLQQTGEYPVISSIVEASDGALWFATAGGVASGGVGVYRFEGKNWTHFRKGSGLPFDEITLMTVSPGGAIWFGGDGIARYEGKSWTVY